MYCVQCGSKTTVINSRATGHAGKKMRRRECLSCRYRFSTTEELIIKKKPAPPKPKRVRQKRLPKRRFSYSELAKMSEGQIAQALEKGWIIPEDLERI